MALQQLVKAEWRSYCDRISRGLAGRSAELEVVSLDLGDHVEARWVPLYGIVYDPKSGVLEIALEGIDHLIDRPRDLYIEETGRGLVAVEIVAEDETRQIVKLREPLVLPAARPRRRRTVES